MKKKKKHVLIKKIKNKKTNTRKCGRLNNLQLLPKKKKIPNRYNAIKLLPISSIKKKILPISILKSLLFILRVTIVIGDYMLEEAT